MAFTYEVTMQGKTGIAIIGRSGEVLVSASAVEAWARDALERTAAELNEGHISEANAKSFAQSLYDEGAGQAMDQFKDKMNHGR